MKNIVKKIILLALISLSFASLAENTLASATTHKPSIIALSPHIVEMLYDIGAGEQIIGTTTFADYPEQAKEIVASCDLVMVHHYIDGSSKMYADGKAIEFESNFTIDFVDGSKPKAKLKSTDEKNAETIKSVIPNFEFKPSGDTHYAYRCNQWNITRDEWAIVEIYNKTTKKRIRFNECTEIIEKEDILNLAK